MERRNILHSKIVEYWQDKVITAQGNVELQDRNSDNDSLPVISDWGEPACWACDLSVDKVYETPAYLKQLEKDYKAVWNFKNVKSVLEKAHIIPHALTHNDDVSNLFLLCSRCHKESPDYLNSQYFFKWVYDKKTNSFAGFDIRELDRAKETYREITGKKIEHLKWENANLDKLQFDKANVHGLSYSNSTRVSILVEFLKSLE